MTDDSKKTSPSMIERQLLGRPGPGPGSEDRSLRYCCYIINGDLNRRKVNGIKRRRWEVIIRARVYTTKNTRSPWLGIGRLVVRGDWRDEPNDGSKSEYEC